MIIEGNYHGKQIILATSTAPGTAKYQNAYGSELIGFYHTISIIETICEKNIIRSRRIKDKCDGINTIKEAMHDNNTYSFQ